MQNPNFGPQPPFDRQPEETRKHSDRSIKDFKKSLEERAEKFAGEMKDNRRVISERDGLSARIKDLEQRLDFVKNHDELTRLLNREGFSRLVRKYQNEGVDGTLLMLDLDDFKKVNTYGGQLLGDAALKAVAIELMQLFRINTDKISRDTVSETDQGASRAGGEEFLVFLPGASPQQIHDKFKKFDDARQQEISKIEIPFDFHNTYLSANLMTFSGGITELKHAGSLEEAIIRANVAMRVAKDSQKNQLIIAKEDQKQENQAV